MTTPNQTPSIQEMNRVIAVFDGWQHRGGGVFYKIELGVNTAKHVSELTYHSDWNELHRIFEKCYKVFQEYYPMHVFWFTSLRFDTPIEEAHEAIYKFIQWYNQRKEEQG